MGSSVSYQLIKCVKRVAFAMYLWHYNTNAKHRGETETWRVLAKYYNKLKATQLHSFTDKINFTNFC